MSINAGVWIDHHKAVVVLLTDRGEEILQFASDRDAPERSPVQHAYTRHDFVAEDKLERKTVIQLNKYYDDVIACLREANAILVLGPGEAKGEFTKRLEGQKLTGRTTSTEAADKLTDPQIAARVREHFAQVHSS